MSRPTLLLFGSAGSGKGTQGELLEEQFGYHRVEAGALIRAKGQEDSDIGRKFKEIHDTGRFVTDEMITGLIAEHLKTVPAKTPLLIDAYPLSLGQAAMLLDVLKDSGRDPSQLLALWIKVGPEEAKRRLLNRSQCGTCKNVYMNRDVKKCMQCGGDVQPRAYDYPEAIDKRLAHFAETIMIVIQHYQTQGKLIEINGEQPVTHVFDTIRRALQPYMRPEAEHYDSD